MVNYLVNAETCLCGSFAIPCTDTTNVQVKISSVQEQLIKSDRLLCKTPMNLAVDLARLTDEVPLLHALLLLILLCMWPDHTSVANAGFPFAPISFSLLTPSQAIIAAIKGTWEANKAYGPYKEDDKTEDLSKRRLR